jgi:hypothetical protein
MDQRPWKEPPASKVAAADLSEPQLPLLSMGRESTTHPFSSELAQGFKFYRDFVYSYPYLNQQNPLFLPIIAYTLSTTKLEIRAK